MTAVKKITGEFLSDLEQEFIGVELIIHSANKVRIRAKMPLEATKGSATRAGYSRAWKRVFEKHGIQTTAKPDVHEGMTVHTVRAMIQGDA